MVCNYHTQVFLSVSAVGPGPLSYKWKKDTIDIFDLDYIGVNEPILVIRSFSPEHEGKYTCEVLTHDQMFIESETAKLQLSK